MHNASSLIRPRIHLLFLRGTVLGKIWIPGYQKYNKPMSYDGENTQLTETTQFPLIGTHHATSEKQWLIMHRHLQRTGNARDFPDGALELESWPDLSLVPDEVIHSVARICALLSRTSLTFPRLAQLLGDDSGELALHVRTLLAFGHLTFVPMRPGATTSPPMCDCGKQGAQNLRGFVGRRRQRLLHSRS